MVTTYPIDFSAITIAVGSGLVAGVREENERGEKCSRNWSDNIVLKDIRLSMDAEDPLPNLREKVIDFSAWLPLIHDLLEQKNITLPDNILCNNSYTNLHKQLPEVKLLQIR